MSELTPHEQKVRDTVSRLSDGVGVNPTTVAYALPTLDTYAIVQELVNRGVLERVGGAVRLADIMPPANAEANAKAKTPSPAVAPPVEVKFAEPKLRSPRPYFARLDPWKEPAKQIAARIVRYLGQEGDQNGRVVYRKLYQNLHGARYRDLEGVDPWYGALKYLGAAVRRDRGFIWIDRERMVPVLPSPYKAPPKPRKKKPQTKWFKDVVERATVNGLSISEQIVADREGRTDSA